MSISSSTELKMIPGSPVLPLPSNTTSGAPMPASGYLYGTSVSSSPRSSHSSGGGGGGGGKKGKKEGETSGPIYFDTGMGGDADDDGMDIDGAGIGGGADDYDDFDGVGAMKHSDELEMNAVPLIPKALSRRLRDLKDADVYYKVRRRTKSWPYVFMLILNGIFMVAELVGSILFGSLSLRADAIHMLSDSVSLGIALYAKRLSMREKRVTDRETFGWSRAEFIGGFANAVALLAACVNMLYEAIERFSNLKEVEDRIGGNAIEILIVAAAGLAINIIGGAVLWFTGGDEEGGGGHGHSHGGGGGGHGHSHGGKKKKEDKKKETEMTATTTTTGVPTIATLSSPSSSSNVDLESGGGGGGEHGHAHQHDKKKKKKRQHDVNHFAVVMHVLTDALGSVAVIVSAVIIQWTPWSWRFAFDPICTVIIATMIFPSTIRMIREISDVLMSNAPAGINVGELLVSIQNVAGVLDAHELHVWKNCNRVSEGSVHVLLDKDYDDGEVRDQIKRLFHGIGIHSSSIQTERVPKNPGATPAGGGGVDSASASTIVASPSCQRHQCTDIVCQDDTDKCVQAQCEFHSHAKG